MKAQEKLNKIKNILDRMNDLMNQGVWDENQIDHVLTCHKESIVPSLKFAGKLICQLDTLREEIQKILYPALYEDYDLWLKERVISDPKVLAGEPTFKETRLSVKKIGEMFSTHKEKAIEEIEKDYPYLSELDIHFAHTFYRLELQKKERA